MTAGDEAKVSLRRTLLARRSAIPAFERERIAAAVCTRVTGMLPYARANQVLAYRAIGAEVDPLGAVLHALSSGKRVYYPSVVEDGMRFVADDVSPGGPEAASAPADGLATVALVPGVAFDACGVRLGRGGGHYDRALARLPRAVRIGIACERQVVASLPRDAWDVLMDFIVTEARVLTVATDDRRRVLEETPA